MRDCARSIGRRVVATILLAQALLAGPGHAEQDRLTAAAAKAGVAVVAGTIAANGAQIYYRDLGVGGEAIVFIHGFPETGEVFAPAVGTLGRRYRLIVPDLRGAGLSQRTASGYDKKTLATDIKQVMDQLKIGQAHIVGHDIGARVAYAFAVQYPESLLSLTVAEAFIEGLAGTAEFKQFAPTNPRLRHFALFAKVDEATAQHASKEEELVLSFMNSRSKSRTFSAPEVSRYIASLQSEGGLRAAFKLYEAFDQDAAFVGQADASRLVDVPVLALACANPFGNVLHRQLSAAGLRNVKGVILQGCAHWIFDENPDETLGAISSFLAASRSLR
jgi:pimeloyl-ACP methyl ester carboxylesterase